MSMNNASWRAGFSFTCKSITRIPNRPDLIFLFFQQVVWPSGKMLGGSSSMNGMWYVRGNRKDYDEWAANGAKGWSFRDVFPYFLKLENNKDYRFLTHGKYLMTFNNYKLASQHLLKAVLKFKGAIL